MEEALGKAKILMESLPWIKEHHGKTAVIKYGGNVMLSPQLKESIASDIVLMKYVGLNPVIVHGGGPEITTYMKSQGKVVKFVRGLRVTDKETMDIVKMVLVGKINLEMVSLINSHASPTRGAGRLAVGVSGDDGGLVRARKLSPSLGYVGEVEEVNPKILKDLIKDGFTPVVASIGVGKDGESYNINADSVAAAIAVALKADKMIFLTDVPGLFQNFSDKNSLISELTDDQCLEMIEKHQIKEGMIPKVEACIRVLVAGIHRAHLLDGTLPHALLLEIFTDKGIGTMILPSPS